VREHAVAYAPGGAARRTARLSARVGTAFEDVAARDALPDGELLGAVLADGTPVCLYNDRGTIGAVRDVCSHAEFPLSDGVLHGDGTLECMWHGARYDCRTGAVRRGPAVDPVAVFETRVEGDRILVAARAHQEPHR
jgi:3-phenylpropionate/trans-cinnamate dioxygenase ferredoxin subunit